MQENISTSKKKKKRSRSQRENICRALLKDKATMDMLVFCPVFI